MSDDCKLDAAQGIHSFCREDECVFWRVVEHIDVVGPRSGCAVQYFSFLDGGDEVASWLLSVRQRLEQDCDAPQSESA